MVNHILHFTDTLQPSTLLFQKIKIPTCNSLDIFVQGPPQQYFSLLLCFEVVCYYKTLNYFHPDLLKQRTHLQLVLLWELLYLHSHKTLRIFQKWLWQGLLVWTVFWTILKLETVFSPKKKLKLKRENSAEYCKAESQLTCILCSSPLSDFWWTFFYNTETTSLFQCCPFCFCNARSVPYDLTIKRLSEIGRSIVGLRREFDYQLHQLRHGLGVCTEVVCCVSFHAKLLDHSRIPDLVTSVVCVEDSFKNELRFGMYCSITVPPQSCCLVVALNLRQLSCREPLTPQRLSSQLPFSQN